LTTAQTAFKNGNYALAIYGADYAYALSQPSPSNSSSVLDNLSLSMAENSTYGAWATQFSNEALFYIYQSRSSSNASKSDFYAAEAFSSASLAQVISSDTKLIGENLIITNQTGQSGQSLSSAESTYLQSEISTVKLLIAVVAILLVINLIVMIFLIIKLSRRNKNSRQRGRGKRQR
jgi:hypothetical protein